MTRKRQDEILMKSKVIINLMNEGVVVPDLLGSVRAFSISCSRGTRNSNNIGLLSR